MNTNHIIELLARYEKGTCTNAEKELVDKWFEQHGAANGNFDEMDARAQQQWIDALFTDIQSKNEAEKFARPIVKLWPRIIGIAAAVIGIAVCVYLFTTPRHPDTSMSSRAIAKDLNDIAPGHNGATLTFANGDVVDLSDKKNGVIVGDDLRYDDNTLVIQSDPLSSRANAKDLDPSKVGMTSRRWDDKEGKIMAQTARGQTYSIILQDGTKVWLNADSKLEFFSNYRNKLQRIVKLSGEGYFEVAKDKIKPFIVESNGQRVQVLGTHFNISAYKGEGIKTTLLEGSVKVSPTLSSRANAKDLNTDPSEVGMTKARGGEAVTLHPNQQSLVTANQNITVKQVDAEDAILWKSGKFSFDSEEIGDIMKQVSRWYDVEVLFHDNVQQIKVNGSVSRFANISVLLEKLEQTGLVHFKVEGRTVMVSK